MEREDAIDWPQLDMDWSLPDVEGSVRNELWDLAAMRQCPLCTRNGLTDYSFENPMVTTGNRIVDFRIAGNYGCVLCAVCAVVLECAGIPKDWHGWARISKYPSSTHIRVSWENNSVRTDVELYMHIPDNSGVVGHRSRAANRLSYSGDTSSPDSLHWAKIMIAHCIRSHAFCNSSQAWETPGFLPTRLICVETTCGDDMDVVLMNGADIPNGSAYVALSHCWGKTPIQCITTKETLADRMRCIPWATLPRTFQDAITFVRGLRVQYLWIDSICIIQNDTQDWERESTKMLSVYQNAHVTLAGVYAEDSSGGLFSKLEQGRPVLIQPLEESSDYGYVQKSHRFRKRDSDTSPLFTRAWAFQERLVARRVLFFTEYEIHWECLNGVECQCGRDADHEDALRRGGGVLPKNEFRKYAYGPQMISDVLLDDEVYSFWHRLVERYSKLNLTVQSDKLPGIAAVAKMMQSRRPGQAYFAGLWSGSLIRDLQWRADENHRLLPRPTPPTAPTWSWASIGSGVVFKTDWTPEFEEVAVILRVRCEETIAGPFGHIKSGRLALLGRSLPCRLKGTSPIGIYTATQDSALIEDDCEFIFWDCADVRTQSEYQEVVLLEIMRCSGSNDAWESTYTFLILSPNGDDHGTYSRIGYMSTGKVFIKSLRYRRFENSCQMREHVLV